MYKIKCITTVDREVFFKDAEYDADRNRFDANLQGESGWIQVCKDGSAVWINKRNIVSVHLYNGTEEENHA